MKVQSLSIVVPNKECMNKCPFCVARMVNSNIYENKMSINDPHYDINVREYLKRLKFVADSGCQTIILTGTSEPQQNKQFLATFALLHQMIGSPFTNIEMQTTGMLLDGNRDYIRFLRNFVGVNTVALSVNSLNEEVNNEILGHNPKADNALNVKRLTSLLKEYDFNVRICCNLTSEFNQGDIPYDEDFYGYLKEAYHADQVTFRKMYASDKDTPQGEWLAAHEFPKKEADGLSSSLKWFPVISKTPYGANIRDVQGMSVIYDEDCMGKNPDSDVKKFLILRPNCKLYSQWDTKASLVM